MANREIQTFSIASMRAIEKAAEEKYQITPLVLMQRAGKAAVNVIAQYFSGANYIIIVAGSGNNGGDGYVLATLLHQVGIKVEVLHVGSVANLPSPAKEAHVDCVKAGVHISQFNADATLLKADLLVDALCGIGLHDALLPELAAAVEKMQATKLPILALDIPSGVHADSGGVQGCAVQATMTVTFIALKLGLLTGKGIGLAGKVICADLDLPDEILETVTPNAIVISDNPAHTYLKKRTREWHKGLSGHLLIVGGDLGMPGACQLAAIAALRVGAGLVSVAMHPKNAKRISGLVPELMCHGVNDGADLEPLLAKANVIVVGPGLGQSEWSEGVWQAVMKHPSTKVVDADGLNRLAKSPVKHHNWLLTPHPLEAARLLQSQAEAVALNRPGVVAEIQQRFGGACILKGAGSLIAAENEVLRVCTKGNPGMATAGMGDLLSGVLGGLLAQGLSLAEAAKLGVYIHAVAGDLAALDGERGMIASDLLPFLRKLVN